MDENFFYLVTFIALIYAIVLKAVQGKVMDKTLMNDVQAQSKRINELYKEASKSNSKSKLDEVAKMNEELMPKMNQMLFGQMKAMAVILAIFFAFSWMVGSIDPTIKNDLHINMTGEGANFTASYNLSESEIPSFWYATVKMYKENNEIGSNQTVFFVGQKTEQILWPVAKGPAIPVRSDKESYLPGQAIKVSAESAQADRAVLVLDRGDRFYVDLPITIPLINLRRIYDSQSWFVFAAFIISLLVNPVLTRAEKYLPFNKAEKSSSGVSVAEKKEGNKEENKTEENKQ